MAAQSYNADSIEVLEGLDPVRKRPGMYTETARPNHLAQEVIDNAVDEALEGHATELRVTLRKDGSMSVNDDGRGMPVDVQKKTGLTGVELILTKLHSGAKFSSDNYKFSGGLHGVGVSVVNALSAHFEVFVRQDGNVHHMTFKDGRPTSKLQIVDSVGKRNTGTLINFTPNPQYFDSVKFSVPRLRHLLRAKAVLCSGLRVIFTDENVSGDEKTTEWCFEHGLEDYLVAEVGDTDVLPESPFTGSVSGHSEAADWAVLWVPEGPDLTTESYVNLIPTLQGGTHVSGLRSGLLDATREFCEFRNLVPRGIRISADDVFERCAYVLSAKLVEPQFSGQTKERLNSREAATFISAAVKDSFSLWLSQHVEAGEKIAELAITRAQDRLRAGKKVARKKVASGPALPGKLADCSSQDAMAGELFLVEGDSAGGSAKQARDRETQAILPLRGKILNTWEVDSGEILASNEVHDISVALGIDPGINSIEGLRYGKVCILADADSDGLHIASLLIALFVRHFPALVENGHVFVAMPPLYRIDVGKEVFYAIDESDRTRILAQIEAEKMKGKVVVQRFKGLGEMNPKQLRETAMAPETRRLVRLEPESQKRMFDLFDMLLSKRRSPDRKSWLESKGDLAQLD